MDIEEMKRNFAENGELSWGESVDLLKECDYLTHSLKAAHIHIDFLQEGKQEGLKKAEEIAKRETAREIAKMVDGWLGCSQIAYVIRKKYGLEEE